MEQAVLAPAAASRPAPPALMRWSILILISLALFGNYYAYDAVGPLADSLQRLLHYSDTQIGTLNAIYSFPNIVMVLVGGIIVDRIGTRLATLAFSVICLVGAVVTACSPSFTVMAIGRLLFGLGAESMIVAVTVAIGHRPMVRGAAAGLRLRHQPEPLPGGLHGGRFFTDLGAEVLRAGLAAAFMAGSLSGGYRSGGLLGLLLPGALLGNPL